MTSPVLTLSHVRKSFGGVRALVDASLSLYPGQATALVGENGAGKSTLVKILAGVYRPDGGEIQMQGQPVRVGSADRARELGISVIHQESMVFDNLSVAENIFIGNRPKRARLIDWQEMRRRARKLLEQLEAPFDPDTPAGHLSVAQKHLVQIARGLCCEARVMIMDEPTAALSHHEVRDLIRIVQGLKQAGCAVLFISHKFEEIFAIAERYAVFRDGAAVGAGTLAETNNDELIRLMVGRPMDQVFPKRPATYSIARSNAHSNTKSEAVLKVENLCRAAEFADISFSVRRGEILGVYGLVGAGRSELMQTLFGLQRPASGRIFIDGTEVRIGDPQAAIRTGLACVPEDRQHQGAVLPFSIASNIGLPNLAPLARFGLLQQGREDVLANEWIAKLQIKASGPAQAVEQLSGGNQQKVVLAKWLAMQPSVLILDEPTKGIDVGAKAAVHAVMSEYVQSGRAVIMVSSELPEILGMSDRVLVMRRGRVSALFDRADATPEKIVQAATDA